MKRLLILLALLTLPALAETFTVEDCQSGDSIRLNNGERVRLFGVDAPELTQAYGKESAEWLRRKIEGLKVTIEGQGKDTFGRRYVVVILNHRKINQELVAAGYAWWDQRNFPNEADLERLQKEAQQEKRGLWADPSPIPPWEFRKP